MEDIRCKVPDPTIFRISGYGTVFVAKKEGDQYNTLLAEISLENGGITTTARGYMDEATLQKELEELSSDYEGPLPLDGDIETAKLYLLGSYAYMVGTHNIDRVAGIEEDLNTFGSDHTNFHKWSEEFTKGEGCASNDLLSVIKRILKRYKDYESFKPYVSTKIEFSVSNPDDLIDNIDEGEHFMAMDESDSSTTFSLLVPYEPEEGTTLDLMAKTIQGAIKEGKGADEIDKLSRDLRDKLQTDGKIKDRVTFQRFQSLLIDEDEILESLGLVDVKADGTLTLTSNTLADTAAITELIIESEPKELKLKSASYDPLW